MQHTLSRVGLLVTIPLTGALTACGAALQDAAEWEAAGPAAEAVTLRLEISLSERELYEFREGELVNTFPVAVGQPGHETPPGDYTIHRIDWNPDWTPPDSPWAAGREYKPPGHPGNPMGRVRMAFAEPYTIHGTEVYESLGRAASHGSVRMGNDAIIELAPRVQAAGGEDRAAGWYDEVLATPTEMVEVPLPDAVPLAIVP
jgi:hypothetical protein